MHVLESLLSVLLALRERVRAGGPDRGDVPGWVLITLMTAGLVAALWAIAGPKLQDILNQALTLVKV